MSSTTGFIGSVPDLYERHLAPLLVPYARDLAKRVGAAPRHRILELACGTGLLTRELVTVMDGASLVATDLNEPMIQVARRIVTSPKVAWRPADAMALPFDDRSFDLVVCQFGVMFFPDKVAAAREVRRVLVPGGTFLFNTWASLQHNPLGRITYETVNELFPHDPPTFMRVPFGYGDPDVVRVDLEAAGFGQVTLDVVDCISSSPSAREAAVGIVEGNPLMHAIRERASLSVEQVTGTVARAIERAYGSGQLRVPTRAFVATAV